MGDKRELYLKSLAADAPTSSYRKREKERVKAMFTTVQCAERVQKRVSRPAFVFQQQQQQQPCLVYTYFLLLALSLSLSRGSI